MFKEAYKSFVKDIFNNLKKSYKKFYLSIDTHYDGYYRMRVDLELIHKFKKEKGSNSSYKFIAITLGTEDFSLIIYCDILVKGDSLLNHVEEILHFAINDLGINPSDIIVLTDREFKDFEIIKIFERYGCNSFIPKNSRIKYYLENEYEKGENWKFDYFIDQKTISKLVIAEDEIITNNEKKKIYYTFLTNIDFDNPEVVEKLN
ncbi:hypothetical protein ACO3VM_04875 [Methanocaldococcus sp. 10A]